MTRNCIECGHCRIEENVIGIKDGQRLLTCNHPDNRGGPEVIDEPATGDCHGFVYRTTRVAL